MATKKTQTRRIMKIPLIELLRPGARHSTKVGVELAFEALRALIIRATPAEHYSTRHRWHSTCVLGVLGGAGAVNGQQRPVCSLDDLFPRFHEALLGDTGCRPELDRWRKEQGIGFDTVLEHRCRHYGWRQLPLQTRYQCEHDLKQALKDLLEDSVGTPLGVSLNPFHKSARTTHRIDCLVSATGFEFTLHYGFKSPFEDRMDSEWSHTLAHTENEEPFVDTLSRAIDRFTQLTARTPQAHAA